MKSVIFTKKEIDALNQRLKGNKNDPTGIYSARVKPKVNEILQWFEKEKELRQIK